MSYVTNKIPFILSILFIISCCKADNAGDAAQKALDNLKSLWNGASGFITGMGESFGYVPEDYRYSFRVWNDSPGIILAARQKLTKVLGAGFQGEVDDYKYLAPYTNTEGAFNDLRLYFIIWLLFDKDSTNYNKYKSIVDDYAKIGAETATPLGAAIGALVGSIQTTMELEKHSFFQKSISTPMDVKEINFYRAYTYKGKIQGELLGVKTTTNEFSGVFYNSSDSDVTLQFVKDGITYKVTLEKNTTFSLLHSSSGIPGSIRPLHDTDKRAFTFFQGSEQIVAIPITSEGICNVQEDPATKKLIPGSPMVYTFEIAKNNNALDISMQGLAIGHYDQPFDYNNKSRDCVRDINPIECHVWYQSAQQAQAIAQKGQDADPMQMVYDDPNPVWLFYKSKDYTYQKKVAFGQKIDFTLVRPQLSENKIQFFAVRLQTNDDTKALQFLNRLADGKIGQDALKNVTPIYKFDEKTVLTAAQPNTRGLVDDSTTSGVKGYILFADIITPRGVGIGPFYYLIKPSIVHLAQLVDLLNAYVDVKKYTQLSTMQQELISKIQQWIVQYPSNKTAVVNDVTNYLEQKGVDEIISDPSNPQKTLNADGKDGVNTLIEGPLSIVHYPIQQQSGTNEYVYYLGQKPDGWPT